MTDISCFLLLILIVFGLGRIILGFFVKNLNSSIEEFVFSVGLGLGLLAYIVYIIGSIGFLYRTYIFVVLLFCGLAAVFPVLMFVKKVLRSFSPKSIYNLELFDKLLWLCLIVVILVTLIGSLAPETGNDALAYHLNHPKIFIQEHKVGYIPFTRESLWPYLTEMLFTLGLILKNASLAKMFNYLFGFISVFSVFSFGLRFFNKKDALLSAVLFCTAPGIFMQSVYSYVDLSLCFYSFSAFYALMLWQKAGGLRLLILAGIFTGLALSVKIIGLFTLLAILVCLIYVSKGFLKDKAHICFVFLLSVLAVSFIWYLRSYIVLHNPVYPFFHKIFNSGWHSDLGRFMGARQDLLGFLRLPWDLVMNFSYFGGEQIGVIFLAFLPSLFFVKFNNKLIRCLFIFIFVYTLLWFFVDQNIRFAFINFAFIYMLIATGFNNIYSKIPDYWLKLLLITCIIFNISLSFYYNRDSIKLKLGIISEEQYLLKNERAYSLAKWTNANLENDALLIFLSEPRLFYFNQKSVYYPIARDSLGKTNSEDAFRELVKNYKQVYVVSTNSVEDRFFSILLQSKTPIFKTSFAEENKVFDYALYKVL